MAVEIERKFLVAGDDWRKCERISEEDYRQAYLAITELAVVRIRLAASGRAWIGIKERRVGRAREEFEYAIASSDAKQLLELALGTVIEKRRYRLPYQGKEWEVDEFFGDNEGLVMAEIELDRPDEDFARPPWLGREVTHESAYYNVALAMNPWRKWKQSDTASGSLSHNSP